jgi:hypothetical protein
MKAQILGSIICLSAGSAAAKEIEIGSDYQLSLSQNHEQLQFQMKTSKLVARGSLSDTISWLASYRLKESEVDRFYLVNRLGDDWELTIGQQKIKIYGLHRKLNNGTLAVWAAYLAANPLKEKVAMELSYKAAGKLSLQLIEDYSRCIRKTSGTDPNTQSGTATGTVSCTSWNDGEKMKQPAVAFEWLGALGSFSPLIQYSLYDLGKSSSGSLSLRYQRGPFDAYVDFTRDLRRERFLEDPNSSKTANKLHQNILVYAEYKRDRITPFLQWSTFKTDLTGKGLASAKEIMDEANTAGKFDRNDRTLGVGSYFDHWGPAYRPFLAVTHTTGKARDPQDANNTLGQDKSELTAGISGRL